MAVSFGFSKIDKAHISDHFLFSIFLVPFFFSFLFCQVLFELFFFFFSLRFIDKA